MPSTETVNRYENMTNDEFDERLYLKFKIWATYKPESLAHWVLTNFYDDAVEQFNNEILDEWEYEQNNEEWNGDDDA